ncbi:MAG TPA: hypothetical protein VIJ94_10840 [Caulobacteraceae bacterium]
MTSALGHGWRRAAAAVLVLAVLAAGAEAAPSTGPMVVLRGPQTVRKPAPLPPAQPAAPAFDPGSGPPPLADLSPIPRFNDDPVPRFNEDPAPRVGGLDLRGGGAQCRTACAESRYLCRATDEPDQCDGAWGQCVAACSESSPSPL